LRQRREQQGIELRTIADQTKIKLSLLDALERDDVSQWPSGIFRRAYVRTYAKAIALDPDEVVREFVEAHPEPFDVAAIEEIASLADGSRANGGPQTRLRHIMGSALGSFSWRRRGGVAEEPALAAHASPSISIRPPAVASRPLHEDLHFIGLPSAATVADLPAETVEPPPVPCAEVSAVEEEPADAGSPIELAIPADLVPEIAAAAAVAAPAPDFMAIADLCTGFARVSSVDDVRVLLAQTARILDATGLIVWVWDPAAGGLRPVLAHGYSDRVLAQLPTVGADADNATAAAFRSAETCVIPGGSGGSGALVVPMLTAGGCAGALAIELRDGAEQQTFVRAVATIVAASLTQFVAVGSTEAAAEPEPEPAPSIVAQMPPPRLRASAGR
jgi:hypothetical protein